MSSAADELRVLIAARGGRVSFADFMHLALYGEHGFYSSGGRAGRRGDFLTSPEVGPLFGAVIARALDAEWERLGRPDGFTVVDAGAGPGTLARSVISARPGWLERGRYIAVESSSTQRAMHPEGVESVATMPAHIDCGVVIANELLDNLAFRLFVLDDGWREAFVTARGEDFAEVLGAVETSVFLPAGAPHGARAPLQDAAREWLASTLGSLGRGRVVVIDYCSALTAEVAVSPWREWLRTYRGHERGAHYLREPGSQDITAQVCIDQLVAVREPDAVRTQAQFLQKWGIDEFVVEGKRAWEASAAAPTLDSMRMRSRVSESEALLDASGLGGFMVIEWQVG
ncbi:MAG: hypothetical protein FJW53_03135 [Actinobacteria bacterium]|nr:hypothetical protein [Actinomycetota bacterium]